MSLACITAMRFAPLRIDGSFTLHALTAGKKRGEKRPWKILPLFPPSQQQTPLSDSRQIRKCAGRMPPPFLPPFFPPSVSCQIGGGERAGGRAARVVGSPLPHDDVFPPGLARSIPPSFRCNAECKHSPTSPMLPSRGSFVCHTCTSILPLFSQKCRRVTNASLPLQPPQEGLCSQTR